VRQCSRFRRPSRWRPDECTGRCCCARAIENHAYVIAAAQAGTTAEGFSSFGHSLIIGPWGEVLAESDSDEEDILIATVDTREVDRRRSQIAVLTLQRPDLYRSLPEPGRES
jgi:predicted amidohydrolase